MQHIEELVPGERVAREKLRAQADSRAPEPAADPLLARGCLACRARFRTGGPTT